MSDNEFDLIDELYFIVPYSILEKSIDLTDEILKSTLKDLLSKGWINCYYSQTDEIEFDIVLFEKEYRNYHYLATKKGLLAHNGKY